VLSRGGFARVPERIAPGQGRFTHAWELRKRALGVVICNSISPGSNPPGGLRRGRTQTLTVPGPRGEGVDPQGSAQARVSLATRGGRLGNVA